MQLNDGMLERRDLDPFYYHLQWWCPTSWFLWILTIWLLIEAEPLLVFFVEELILKTSKAGWSVSAKNVKRSWSWMFDQVLLKLLVNKANFLWGIQLFWALARLACTCLKICFFSNWLLDGEDATICCLLMRSWTLVQWNFLWGWKAGWDCKANESPKLLWVSGELMALVSYTYVFCPYAPTVMSNEASHGETKNAHGNTKSAHQEEEEEKIVDERTQSASCSYGIWYGSHCFQKTIFRWGNLWTRVLSPCSHKSFVVPWNSLFLKL